MTRFKIPTISTDLTKRMEGHTFRVIKGTFLLLSILLIVWIGKLIVFDSNTISVNAYNPRLAKLEEGYIRGSILDADGNVLAYTQMNEAGEKTRVYPYGKVFAHVTGYSGKTKTGLELAMNTERVSASSWLDTLRSACLLYTSRVYSADPEGKSCHRCMSSIFSSRIARQRWTDIIISVKQEAQHGGKA